MHDAIAYAPYVLYIIWQTHYNKPRGINMSDISEEIKKLIQLMESEKVNVSSDIELENTELIDVLEKKFFAFFKASTKFNERWRCC